MIERDHSAEGGAVKRFWLAFSFIVFTGLLNAALCFVPPTRWFNVFAAGMSFGACATLLGFWWLFRGLGK